MVKKVQIAMIIPVKYIVRYFACKDTKNLPYYANIGDSFGIYYEFDTYL